MAYRKYPLGVKSSEWDKTTSWRNIKSSWRFVLSRSRGALNKLLSYEPLIIPSPKALSPGLPKIDYGFLAMLIYLSRATRIRIGTQPGKLLLD